MEAPKIHSKSRHRRTPSRLVNGHHNNNNQNNVEEQVNSTEVNHDGEAMQNDDVNPSASVEQQEVQQQPQQQQSSNRYESTTEEGEVVAAGTDDKLQKGILGYIDRQLKVQTLSEPPRSPAQRSTRSRSSNEKSPRRKRSKSESRRRRERKIIAAGEMEVRQANETLMRYLKQCSDFNDASLSGDLEIDENLEDRKVHRKTKAERQKKAHLHTRGSKGHASDLTTVLHDLAEDVRHGNDIYNPFTPVISPLEGPPTRIDKLYIQTSSGYRPVDNNNFYKSSLDLDPEDNRQIIRSGVHLSCCVQRIWILLANICHGLLAGLGLAHLLLVFTTAPMIYIEGVLEHYADFSILYTSTFYCLAIICMVSVFDRMDISRMDLPTPGETIQFRWIIIFMIYAATITLSLCCSSTDERLFYFNSRNETSWTEDAGTGKMLNVWNSLSIARSFGAIIGWIFIGLSPNTDKLYAYLLEMEKYEVN